MPGCVIADRAYDSNTIRAQIEAMGSVVVIPLNAGRIPVLLYDRHQ